ncbi:MAG: GIY-YIG nuclease family protein [Rhizobiaceae bacterium]
MKRRAPAGYVYFLRAGDEVKIGFSTNLRQRLEKLRNGNAFPVFVCRYVEGTMATERQFHKRFAEYRLRGEWFDLRGSLARFLERHIYPVSLPEMVEKPTPVMDKGIGYL